MNEIKSGVISLVGSLRHIFIDSWLVKLCLTALSAAGINNALLIVLILLLVIIDTLTKLIGLIKGYVACVEEKPLTEVTKKDIMKNTVYAFFAGVISSKGLKGLPIKLGLYGTLVLIALFLEQSPKKVIFGVDALHALADGIFVAIVCTEVYSILENFRDMGSSFVDRLQSIIVMIFERMGGKWSITGTVKKEEEIRNG